jgi:shikimate 5-dehydrogenase/shikimate kinase
MPTSEWMARKPVRLGENACHGLMLTDAASVNSSSHSIPRDTAAPAAATLDGHVDRTFDLNASIVLIGMRGTGKSTLAIMASMACRRRIVEIESLFQENTGFSTAKYRKQFGAANHNLRQEELLRSALETNTKHAIITCNGGSLEKNGQMLMQEFAKTHPVVLITRDTQSVCDYLGGIDPRRLEDMLAFTTPILRRCSNYDFHNVAESRTAQVNEAHALPIGPSFVTLKRAQRTFLRFLSLIMSVNDKIGATRPPLEPGYPLSDVPVEAMKYTCAVQVPISDILAPDVNIQQAEYGSDAFEIVVDTKQYQCRGHSGTPDLADEISICMSKVRRSTVVPTIFHVIPPDDVDEDNHEAYFELLYHGLRTAPDFITLDLSGNEKQLARFIASKGRSMVIGHLHAERAWNDEHWIAAYEKATRLGCVLARFTRPAKPLENDFYLHQFRHSINDRPNSIPLTCYNTGKVGRRSACFSQHLTPVMAASTRSSPSDVDVNSQLPHVAARELTQALYASFTLDPMEMFILGAALGYTVSPAMHNAAYEVVGLPHRFNRIKTSSLNSLKELVRSPNFGGSIIIQPYKVEVISLMDSMSQHARAIGAVNTLIPVRHLNADGSVPGNLELFHERNQSGPVQALYGENTEWIGIRSCVTRGLSPANAIRPTSCGLIIGAGGMARAAVYALIQLGVKNIAIFNRTFEKAGKLVAHFQRLLTSANPATFHIIKSRDSPWPESFRQPTIVISCIPTDPIDGGPAPQFTLPSAWMRSPTGGMVLEIEYKTLNTPLMQQVQMEGSRWIYHDGLDFLPEQAFAQFELFTAKRAPRRRMREEVLRAWRSNQGEIDAETERMLERRMGAIDEQEP